MRHLIFALLLVLGPGMQSWAEDEAQGGADTASSAAAAEPQKPEADQGTGIHFTISADTDDDDSDKQLKREVVDRVLNVIEKAAKDEGKLDAEDKKTLTKLLMESDKHDYRPNTVQAVGGLLVGAIAIIVIFGMPVMIVAAVMYASYRKKRLVHDTINQYLASGKDIPPEIMEGLHRETTGTPKSNLHKGLVLMGVGLGIVASFALMGEQEAAFIGLIPLFIGAAQLLIWMIEKGGNGKNA